uniref:Aldehyde dehydrogenase n=1 Tax=Ananas comosus var. bracteatus TaxID=296719 RepID=A0A6V7P1B2_ANACO|nr:unnamed protein product [Ananas comosus var. bracteatus]
MAAEVAAVVEEVRRGFESGRTRVYEWREAQIRAIARMIAEREGEITMALRDDLAKPEIESYLHEVDELSLSLSLDLFLFALFFPISHDKLFMMQVSMAKSSCMFALKELTNWVKPEKVKSSITTYPSTAEIVSEPLGVVLVISAWNYPFLLSIDPIVGAVAAGNTVVLKPSELAPATSSLFAKILPEYVDNSCIKVVEGAVPETTALLEQEWDKIFYTGNGKVARIVMAAAAKHLTPVVLELGGKSPVVVDSNIDLDVAAKRIVVGKWGCNNGQACIAPDYIVTTKSFAPQLVDALKTTLEKFYGKDPLASKDLSRIVNFNHFNRLTSLLDDEGVSDKIVYGGQRDEKGLKIAPTLLLNVPNDSPILKDEIFGPLLPIVTVDEVEDSFNIIKSKTKPLAAYLFTKNKKLEEEFVKNISSGLSNPYLPFGGVGESGTGSYHGKFSFDAFSHKKAVLSRGFGGEARARYPPYTPQKQRILRGLIDGSIISLLLALFGFPRD